MSLLVVVGGGVSVCECVCACTVSTHRHNESLPAQNIRIIHRNVPEMLHSRFADVIQLLQQNTHISHRAEVWHRCLYKIHRIQKGGIMCNYYLGLFNTDQTINIVNLFVIICRQI